MSSNYYPDQETIIESIKNYLRDSSITPLIELEQNIIGASNKDKLINAKESLIDAHKVLETLIKVSKGLGNEETSSFGFDNYNFSDLSKIITKCTNCINELEEFIDEYIHLKNLGKKGRKKTHKTIATALLVSMYLIKVNKLPKEWFISFISENGELQQFIKEDIDNEVLQDIEKISNLYPSYNNTVNEQRTIHTNWAGYRNTLENSLFKGKLDKELFYKSISKFRNLIYFREIQNISWEDHAT